MLSTICLRIVLCILQNPMCSLSCQVFILLLLFQRQDTFSCKLYLSLVGMHEVPQNLCSVIGQASVALFLDDHDVFCHEHDLLLVGMHKFSQEIVHCTKHNDV